MKQHSYLPESLAKPLTEDEQYQARVDVLRFQQSPGWYRLQQKLEDMRVAKLKELLGATRREHLELAEAAGVVRAIDEFYRLFEKIKAEGDDS